MRRRDKPDATDWSLRRGIVSYPVPAPFVVFVQFVRGGAALLGAEDAEPDGHGVLEELGDVGGIGVVEGRYGWAGGWEEFGGKLGRMELAGTLGGHDCV